jgi:hypothetical protein
MPLELEQLTDRADVRICHVTAQGGLCLSDRDDGRKVNRTGRSHVCVGKSFDGHLGEAEKAFGGLPVRRGPACQEGMDIARDLCIGGDVAVSSVESGVAVRQ